ncbi:hypothetical protein [Bifidobacterium bifidum]|jgi:hypothetical protein|uniref:hypothetical protein n=2 Tax=Bifidobacterium bifidum TaxID=1681 RepID=UPI0034A322B7
MEDMGYQNTQAVHELAKKGRLAYRRGDNLGIYTLADLLLTYMAEQTYDWDRERNRPPEKLRKVNAPCRYYTLGWRSFAYDYAMVMLTPEQAMSADADKIMRRRELNARKQVSDAFVWLQGRGVIKKLEPASLGNNAGFLLLLGDDEENRAVEQWARQCLNLPVSR